MNLKPLAGLLYCGQGSANTWGGYRGPTFWTGGSRRRNLRTTFRAFY